MKKQREEEMESPTLGSLIVLGLPGGGLAWVYREEEMEGGIWAVSMIDYYYHHRHVMQSCIRSKTRA